MNEIEIRKMDSSLLERSLPLIAAYQKFYGVSEISNERNLIFFSYFLDNIEWGIQFAALRGEEPVGFATIYIQPSSLTARPYCIMNDLYTVPEMRGKGVGKALVEHCRDWAAYHGFSAIDWMTQDSNKAAQSLYDQFPAQKSAWFYYSLKT